MFKLLDCVCYNNNFVISRFSSIHFYTVHFGQAEVIICYIKDLSYGKFVKWSLHCKIMFEKQAGLKSEKKSLSLYEDIWPGGKIWVYVFQLSRNLIFSLSE